MSVKEKNTKSSVSVETADADRCTFHCFRLFCKVKLHKISEPLRTAHHFFRIAKTALTRTDTPDQIILIDSSPPKSAYKYRKKSENLQEYINNNWIVSINQDKFRKFDKMECPICLNVMTTNRVRTICGHRFHRVCIMAELQL